MNWSTKICSILLPLLALVLVEEPGFASTPRARSKPKFIGIGSFSSSLFKFNKTQEDDGVGYGWQVAEPTLKFVDGRQEPTQVWTCTLNVGMPLRTQKLGKILAQWAAETSAEVATAASSAVMHSRSAWTPAAFCKAFKDEMVTLFKSEHEGLGARVEVVGSAG